MSSGVRKVSHVHGTMCQSFFVTLQKGEDNRSSSSYLSVETMIKVNVKRFNEL